MKIVKKIYSCLRKVIAPYIIILLINRRRRKKIYLFDQAGDVFHLSEESLGVFAGVRVTVVVNERFLLVISVNTSQMGGVFHINFSDLQRKLETTKEIRMSDIGSDQLTKSALVNPQRMPNREQPMVRP